MFALPIVAICAAVYMPSVASAESLRVAGSEIRLYHEDGGRIKSTDKVMSKSDFDAANVHDAARDQTSYLGVTIGSGKYWVKAIAVDSAGRKIDCPAVVAGSPSGGVMGRSNGAGEGCKK